MTSRIFAGALLMGITTLTYMIGCAQLTETGPDGEPAPLAVIADALPLAAEKLAEGDASSAILVVGSALTTGAMILLGRFVKKKIRK